MGAFASNALLGLGGILDYIQTQQHNQRVSGYRDDALDYLDQQDYAVPTLNEIMTEGYFDDQPSSLFNPSSLSEAIMALKKNKGYSLDEAYDEFQDQLSSGLYDSQANLDEGLAGLRRLTSGGVDELNRGRMELGGTFGLLDLDDPDARYQQALTFGNEAASANQNAALRSEIDNSFGEAARTGTDPFEAGAFDDTRRRLTNNRYNDLFQSRAAAAGERNRIQEFNVGARQGALNAELEVNRNIDTAISALLGQEIGSAGTLYGDHMGIDADLRTNMLANLYGRQTSIEDLFTTEIGDHESEIAALSQQGREAEAERLRANLELAQSMRMGEAGMQESRIAQRLAVLLHDPEILAMIQPLMGNLPWMQED